MLRSTYKQLGNKENKLWKDCRITNDSKPLTGCCLWSVARFYTPKEFLCQNETENATDPSRQAARKAFPLESLSPKLPACQCIGGFCRCERLARKVSSGSTTYTKARGTNTNP